MKLQQFPWLLSFVLLYVILISPVALFAAWFLFRAVTWTGVALALFTLIASVLPVSLFFWLSRGAWGRGWLSLGLAFIGVALLVLILWATPDGSSPPGSPVRHRFTRPFSFQRYSVANIVPEIEQMNLGFVVMPLLDSLFTFEQSRRVTPFTLDLYRAMEQDPHFHRLGSAMGLAYAEVLGQPFDAGHYYLYIPHHRPAKALPVLVFLHGSFGNFKTYTWVWSQLAEQQGMVIIAPSFGFGNWRYAESIAVVSRALEDAATQVEIDPERIYLAGLSNGGLGVSHLAAAQPERFQGLIFLSPVMDTKRVADPTFLEKWQGRPVLVISGAVDERIPLAYVERQVTVLRAGGVTVTDRVYPGEDHFLFFSQPEAVLEDISLWLSKGKEE